MEDELLYTPIFVEITLLKNFLQEIKPIILKNGGKKFEEGGSSRGDGAAHANLEFVYKDQEWILRISTEEGRRELKRISKVKGWIRKREIQTGFLELEIQFSLERAKGEIPSHLKKAITLNHANVISKGNHFYWSYFLQNEQEGDKSLFSKEKNGERIIELFQREKTNMEKNIQNILEDIFKIYKAEEASREAAK